MITFAEMFDAVYKSITGLATLGILWGVWKIAWWVKTVETRIGHNETQLQSQGSMLQQAVSDIAKISGRIFATRQKPRKETKD